MSTALPFDQLDGFIWYDGQFVPWKEAKLHVITHGLHYGGCVFEGERAYNGKIFKLMEHSQRLVNSAKIIDMNMPWTTEEVARFTQETFDKSGYQYAYIRPLAWRGPEQMGISGLKTKTHMAIACWEWATYFTSEAWDKGISLRSSKWRRPDPTTAPTNSKAAGLYMIGTLAKQESERAGYHDALMMDYRGYVAESSGANLFMVKDGIIYTPVPDCFLNGITRQTIIEIARGKGLKVVETYIKMDELMAADEVFVTGTAAEVTAVSKIDHQTFNVGPVARLMKDTYHDLVRA